MQLRSCVAVAMAVTSSCSSDSTPSLGTYICLECDSKKIKKKKKEMSKVAEKTVIKRMMKSDDEK